MKHKLYKIFLIILTFAILTQSISAVSNECYNWYCKRNNNHMQPCCESNMRFIEDYDGYYVDKKHGDECSERVIYLTFDAGYENGNIGRILDTLKEKGVPAAFFILANLVKTNTELVKRMVDEGHIVCNHTASHRDMTKLSDDEFAAELARMEKLYSDLTGHEIAKYYRPPEGKFSEANLKKAKELGYKTIFWSFAYADWDNNKQPDPERAIKLIIDNAHNGEIMLLHPTSKTNADILGRVIDELRAQGYSFGSLDQLTAG